ncbi:unnamed protein product [Linum trigynum]|uniref:Uncharacterized protein n=1 Tax=Linum trigynum TaxID=586398 RepID=A0AAV2E609_9ROSI
MGPLRPCKTVSKRNNARSLNERQSPVGNKTNHRESVSSRRLASNSKKPWFAQGRRPHRRLSPSRTHLVTSKNHRDLVASNSKQR